MTHRNWGVPPPMQRFPERYYKQEPIIAHRKRRERILYAVVLVGAIVAIMSFGSF
jgi:hypothetical protein